MLLVGGIWDAVNDPLIGVLLDRVRTRWGRRRPFFLFNALPLAATFTMLWWVPPMGDLGKAAWYALAFVLFDTCFTLMTVPYGALTAELTEDYDERTEITGWRMATSMLGGLVAAFFVPVIVGVFTRKSAGYFVAGAGFGLLAVVPYLMLFFTTKERFAATARPRESVVRRVRRHPEEPRLPVRRGDLPPLLGLGEPRGLAAAVLRHLLGAHPGPARVRARGRPGRGPRVHPAGRVPVRPARQARRLHLIAAGWWALVMLALAAIPGTAHTLAYVLAGLAGFGVAGAHVVPWSMVPDVIEADELATGTRREGAFYGVVVFIQKSGTAFMLAIVQWILGWTGYRPGEEQPASVLLAIRLLIGVAPFVLLGLSMILAAKSPLGKKEHEALRGQLERRRAAESTGGRA